MRGSVIVPDLVRLSITTISAGLLTKTEAIALLEVMDSGFVDLDSMILYFKVFLVLVIFPFGSEASNHS